jgi:hypothetical protein
MTYNRYCDSVNRSVALKRASIISDGEIPNGGVAVISYFQVNNIFLSTPV